MVDIFSDKDSVLNQGDEYDDEPKDSDIHSHDLNVYLSEDGMKVIANTDYHTRFKDVLWTSDVHKELPIKLLKYGFGSELPLTLS